MEMAIETGECWLFAWSPWSFPWFKSSKCDQ